MPRRRKILKKGGDKPLQTVYTTSGSAGLNPLLQSALSPYMLRL